MGSSPARPPSGRKPAPERAARRTARRRREAAGALLGSLGLFLGFAFVPAAEPRQNLVGPLGDWSFRILTLLLSWGGLVVPVLALVWAVVL
nr:hypothetical protein [Gemmatimonadota bacterium]